MNEKPRAIVEGGILEGRLSADGLVACYKGIPYAAAPLGTLRWCPPQPVQPWPGIRQAAEFGPICPQFLPEPDSFYFQEFYTTPEVQSEDCLYLNVWAPGDRQTAGSPVLVWIHGGRFIEGSGSLPSFDGAALAGKGIVVVTINYRLGLFGFLAHPELSQESPVDCSGNYGLLDQVQALEWVQANIAAFGGDPGRVTVAGQSAGAASVNNLLVSPRARGLFSQAIVQSAGLHSFNLTLCWPLREAERSGRAYFENLGIPDIAAARELSTEQLMASGPLAYQSAVFFPVIDGTTIPYDPAAMVLDGLGANVPLLLGSTADEFTTLLDPALDTVKKIEAAILKDYGPWADDFLALYPINNATPRDSLLELASDRVTATMRQWATAHASQNKCPAFVYRFERRPPGPERAQYGAYHSAELVYVFDTLDAVDRPWEHEDRQLARQTSDYWAGFVTRGRPHALGLQTWPSWTVDNPAAMIFGEKNEIRLMEPDPKDRLWQAYLEAGHRYRSTKIANGLWHIEDTVHPVKRNSLYLIEGTKKALLIDTGAGYGDLAAFVTTLTEKPIELAISHGHFDHTAQADQFATIHFPAKDAACSEWFFSVPRHYRKLADGQVFDLGARQVEVIEVPGHTPGSVVFLDHANRSLISGDAIGTSYVFMQIEAALTLERYAESLARLQKRQSEFALIYGGHYYQSAYRPLPASYLSDMVAVVQTVLAGTVTSEPFLEGGWNGRIASHGRASLVFRAS